MHLHLSEKDIPLKDLGVVHSQQQALGVASLHLGIVPKWQTALTDIKWVCD